MPPRPIRSEPPEVFDQKLSAYLVWQGTNTTELTALQDDVSAKASAAALSASSSAAASSGAIALIGSTGVTAWVAGAYSAGVKTTSPINGRVYVKLTTGTTATDPSLDQANWSIFRLVMPIMLISTSQVAQPNTHYVLTAGGITLTAPSGMLKDDEFQVSNASGTTTNVVDFGSTNVAGLAVGAMKVDGFGAKQRWQWTGNATYGWV